ncbi:MAG TPA: DNA polymerase III subunit delta [Xanthobacteraceae bacterium]|nr:DNA polymerase III subunit delta [Xanthobacteraceae bacterium]
MVALPRGDYDSFVEDPDPRYPVVLIYGPNRGLVSERIETLVRSARGKSADDFTVVTLDGDALASDPGKLSDEARTIGLFGDKRILHVRAGSRSFVEGLKPLLADPAAETLIAIEAGDLAKSAPLRAACEAAKSCAVIPCYDDDARTIGALIDSSVLRAGLAIDRDAKEALVSLVGSDRLATRAEIEKLIFYTGDSKRITLGDVRAVVADASGLALDDLLDAASAGDAKAALRAFAQARESGTSPATIINAAIRHLAQLHKMSLQIDSGDDAEAVIKRNRVFWRRVDHHKRALRRLGSRTIESALASFGEAELESRRSSALADVIAERAILSLAERGKRKAS